MKQVNNYTKSETLIFLKKKLKLKNVLILDQLRFTKKEFREEEGKILLLIKKKFKNNKIIIRSSATDEDKKMSLAGKYKSFANINAHDKNLYKYINIIIKDFKNPKDQFFIQTFINKVEFAGVLFTRDQINNSPYYIINYDYSKKTNLITSGKKNPSMNIVNVYKEYSKIPSQFVELINASKQIEKLFPRFSLDIEFAKKKNKIYIFQCRKLKINLNNFCNYDSELLGIKKKIIKILKKNPTLEGDISLLSNMADWNPAEIIGSISTKFSSSLYKVLITDEVWSKQRKNYGYKNVWPNPLMYNIANYNFIDIRTDLNSFLPSNLSSSISKKVINASLKKLKENKFLHDKIEFEIIPTCYTSQINSYFCNVLNKKEINIYKKILSKLTSDIINPKFKVLEKEKDLINKIDPELKLINKSNLSSIQKIFYLIKLCQKFGTLPFAGIARCAFIGKAIFNNLVENKILCETRVNKFLKSIHTITNIINADTIKLKKKLITKKKFLNMYGHLRPSTYSISNLSYKENFKNYFNLNNVSKNNTKNHKFIFSQNEQYKVNKWLIKNKLNFTFKELVLFTNKSVYLREYSKFQFTKIIDKIFSIIISFMKKLGVERDDIEHLDIKILLNALSDLNLKELSLLIKNNIKNNKKEYLISQKIILPDIISKPEDAYLHYIEKIRANYIGKNIVIGHTIFIKKDLKNLSNLKNKIILIENADPGYDFLFNYNIKGLITMYGGPNSHMSIRCNELSIAAIIGIGKNVFVKIKNANIIEIDCISKKFSIIN